MTSGVNHRFAHFRAGCRDAYKHYYDLYVNRIYYYLLDRTGDMSVAKDKTQESFLILFTDREKINDEAHLGPFLFTIAKNLSLKYLRDRGRLKEVEADLAYSTTTETLVSESPRTEEAKGEILMTLRTSWLSLPARKRRIVALHFWHKKSTAEIAVRLGIDVQTVRNHLAQSIILLRKSLDGRWEEIKLFFS
jgi:RNA polymerase sigma factor (sigma-70 family)